MATDLTKVPDEEILRAAGLVGPPPTTPQPSPTVSGSRPITELSDTEILEVAGLGGDDPGGLVQFGKDVIRNTADVAVGIPEGLGRVAIGLAKVPGALGAIASGIAEEIAQTPSPQREEVGLPPVRPLFLAGEDTGDFPEFKGAIEGGKRAKEVFAFGQREPLTQFGGTVEQVLASPFAVYREGVAASVGAILRESDFEGTEEDIDNIVESVALVTFPAVLKTGKTSISNLRSAVAEAVSETRARVEAIEAPPELQSPINIRAREAEIAPEAPVTAPQKPVTPETALERGIPPIEEALAELKAQRVEKARVQLNQRATEIRQQIPLEDVTERIARSSDEFIQEYVPPVGLSVKKVGRAVEATPEMILPEGAKVEGLFPEAEARKIAARGIKIPRVDKIKTWINRAWQQTRHFEHLQSGAETSAGKILFGNNRDGAIIEASRQFEAIREAAKADTFSVLQGITAKLKEPEFKVFKENLLLEDLSRDIDRGMYEKKPLPFGYKSAAEVQADLANFKRIAADNPLIGEALEQRRSYMNELKARLVDKGELPKEVLDYDQYYHHQVLAHVQAREQQVSGGAGVRPKWRGWKKGRQGSALDYNTEYVEAEFEVISQGLENLMRVEYLEKIESIADIAPELKARAKMEGVENFRDFLKDEEFADYVEWQPKEGSTWFKVNSIPEEIMDQYIAKLREVDLADFTEVLAKGRPRRSLIIPERVSRQLDTLGKPKKTSPPERLAKFLNTSWKQWTLLMPLRATKYFINNLSGDLDITLAYDPRIVKPSLIKESYRELLNFHKGKRAPTADIRNATRRGALSAGLTIQEIPDISTSGLFKAIEGQKAAEGAIGKYWRNIREFNNFRENLLRLAAYKHFLRELTKNPDKRLYGASKRTEMDAVYDSPEFVVEDYAGKLSRELIGDYGNISQAGLWARQHLIPFYSWLEINAPRYVRLIRNLPHEGRREASFATRSGTITLVAGKKLVTKSAGLAIKASILAGAINLWNHTMYPDAEERLSDAQRRQLHIILGVREDGDVISMRFQGALSDALSWFGAEDLPTDIAEVIEGKASLADKAEDALKAPVQKVAQGLSPIFKTPMEAATGRGIFPDVFNPRPIRDPAEHVARTFSLDLPYRWATGKPTRGLLADLSSVVFYNTDPGEAAYHNTRSLVFDFKKEKGDELAGFIPTKKSNAIYYYKMALRYGDQNAAQKFLAEYKELGGTTKGLRQSIKRSAPLALLKTSERRRFRETLSPEELVMLDRAEAWYRKVLKQGGSSATNTLQRGGSFSTGRTPLKRTSLQRTTLRRNR